MTATVAVVLLGFVVLTVWAVRRPATPGRTNRDPSLRLLTPTFVRGAVGSAEPLRDGPTSVRAVRSTDADAVASTIDDVVIRTMRWPSDAADHYRTVVRRRSVPTMMVVTERDRDVAIGVVSLVPVPVIDAEPFRRAVRIGIWMGPHGRGQGHMSRALRLLADLMISHDISLTAATAPTNHGAQRVLERAGMVETGRQLVRLSDGSDVDGIIYERLAPRSAGRPTDRRP